MKIKFYSNVITHYFNYVILKQIPLQDLQQSLPFPPKTPEVHCLNSRAALSHDVTTTVSVL